LGIHCEGEAAAVGELCAARLDATNGGIDERIASRAVDVLNHGPGFAVRDADGFGGGGDAVVVCDGVE